LEKENPDLYKKIFEPKAAVDALATEVAKKLNLAAGEGNVGAKESPATLAAGVADAEDTIGEDGEKKHQSRGGKGLVRDESAKLDKEAQKRTVKSIITVIPIS